MRMIHNVGARGGSMECVRRRGPGPRSQRRGPVRVPQHGVEREGPAPAVGARVRRQRGGAQQQQQQRLERERCARHSAHEPQPATHAEQGTLLTRVFFIYYRSEDGNNTVNTCLEHFQALLQSMFVGSRRSSR